MTVDTNAWGADLAELVGKLAEPEILVLGDLMLDRYVWGDKSRGARDAVTSRPPRGAVGRGQ